MDVIEATAEALPLEMLNAANRELTARLSHFEQVVDEKKREMDDQRKRLQFMVEHLGNVRAEIVNTQGLTESKRKEIDSVNNMYRIIERECGRLKQKQRELKREEEQMQDHVTSLENRVFLGNLKMEEFKRAMDFNQEELEQWDEARRQKEEDELAIAQYSKHDEAKMKELTLLSQKLVNTVKEQQKELDEEVIATENAQMDLNRCADEYRKRHNERRELLDEWERVVKSIAESDNSIQLAADQYAKGIEWIMKRQEVKKNLSEELKGLKQETGLINFQIKEVEKKAQQLRDAVPALRTQVQEMDDEVEVMREQVARALKEKRNRVAKLKSLEDGVQQKKTELQTITERRETAASKKKEEHAAAQDLQKQIGLITQLLQDAKKMSRNLEKDIENLASVQFGANQELQKTRDTQSTLLSSIRGCQSQDKNLKAKISQLDSESFQQQVVLYNIEFNVQQMIKKVGRAKGDRTDRERKELQGKIDLLQATLEELDQQHRVLDTQVKRVQEDLRRSKTEIEKLEAVKKDSEDRVLSIRLECGHCNQDLARLEREKEDGLVQVDTMLLRLNRLKKRLWLRTDELVDLEEQKQSLASDIIEREAEIATHHNLLGVEAKMAEDERRRLTNELVDRKKILNALRNRHEVLVGKMAPSLARLSQAQLVVEAAKERAALQCQGDSLDLTIKRMEKNTLKLEKNIAILQASNSDFRHRFDPVTENDDEMKKRAALMEKFRELKVLMSTRALETNDYNAALQQKRQELSQLQVAKDQSQGLLDNMQRSHEKLSQEILQIRETMARYEQAIGKASRGVEESIAKDVALLERKERLELTVQRLLECSKKAGEEVFDRVKKMVVDFGLPSVD